MINVEFLLLRSGGNLKGCLCHHDSDVSLFHLIFLVFDHLDSFEEYYWSGIL